MNDAVDSIINKGVTKKAQRQAANAVRKITRHMGVSFGKSLVGGLVYCGMEEGASWYYNKVADRCFGW